MGSSRHWKIVPRRAAEGAEPLAPLKTLRSLSLCEGDLNHEIYELHEKRMSLFATIRVFGVFRGYNSVLLGSGLAGANEAGGTRLRNSRNSGAVQYERRTSNIEVEEEEKGKIITGKIIGLISAPNTGPPIPSSQDEKRFFWIREELFDEFCFSEKKLLYL